MTDAARADVPPAHMLQQLNGSDASNQMHHIESENKTNLPREIKKAASPVSENVDSCLKPTMPENVDEFGGSESNELSGRPEPGSDCVRNEQLQTIATEGLVNTELGAVAKSDNICENQVLRCGDGIRSCQTGKSSYGQIKNFVGGCHLDETAKSEDPVGSGLAQSILVEDVSNSHINEQFEQPSEDAKQFDTSANSLENNSRQVGHNKRTSKLIKKKYMLRSSAGSERVLRSKVQEKPKEPEESNSAVNVSNGVANKRRGRKKGMKEWVIADEYSRIKKRLQYFLHRIRYEQNLIDAYSSEGWKGSSLEKLRPEKELLRATSEILRRKLKIRDLFQHLDSLCAEGRFPKSLFDSDGQIDSEDIFCAKCGSKDLPADNDIILCDGACDRGFHQFCLEPPLLSKDIPPDDEGWLCPGCDCKVDCIDLLNNSYGTDLTVGDSWEKVFPEEAAAAAREGKDQDNILDGPEDSDDDDYDPDGPGIVEKADGDESSSDESDFSSDSDELEAGTKDDKNLGLSSDDSEDDDFDPDALDVDETEDRKETARQHEQNLGLSSEDSEDDDYDPDAPDVDDNVKQESSSTDFTSDSEDLEYDKPSSDGKKIKPGGNKSSLKDELVGILDSGPGQGGSSPISAKRQVERLDYKRLHDETYGNLPSESSDDEDYGTTAPRKRKKTTEQVSLTSPNGNAAKDVNHCQEGNQHNPQKITRQNSSIKDANNSPGQSLDGCPSAGSTAGKAKLSAHRRLGEAVTKRLYKSFKENQYPDRATKESLAQELGIQAQQVSKWFENMRWSWRHSSGKEAGTVENAPKESKERPVETEQGAEIENPTCNGTQNAELPKTSDEVPENQEPAEESSGQKSTSGRKRGRPRNVRPETPTVVNTPEIGVRTRGRRRSSAS